MKRKTIIIISTVLGVLALLVFCIGPAAPFFVRLGVKPICIQGDLHHLRVASCPQAGSSTQFATPIPIPTLQAQGPIPLIVDDDGSPDGVIALLFLLRNPLYTVKAITVCPGEAHPELFAHHMTQLLAVLGRPDIAVGYGKEKPLEGDNAFPEPWRKASGAFWDISLGEAPAAGEPQPAAELIVKTLNQSPQPVVVFVSGPHTNLAEALRLDPNIAEHIREAHIMGGSIYKPGNIESDWPSIHNRVAEWNIWVDPVAAREVFASGISLHLVPLDGTNQVTWSELDAQQWASARTPEGSLAANLLRWMLRSWSTQNTYIWDLVAAVATSDLRLCPQVPLALNVVVDPGAEQGRTMIVDRAANTQVCLEPDAAQVRLRAEGILSK